MRRRYKRYPPASCQRTNQATTRQQNHNTHFIRRKKKVVSSLSASDFTAASLGDGEHSNAHRARACLESAHLVLEASFRTWSTEFLSKPELRKHTLLVSYAHDDVPRACHIFFFVLTCFESEASWLKKKQTTVTGARSTNYGHPQIGCVSLCNQRQTPHLHFIRSFTQKVQATFTRGLSLNQPLALVARAKRSFFRSFSTSTGHHHFLLPTASGFFNV